MSITEIRPREDVEALLRDIAADGGPGSPRAGTWRHSARTARSSTSRSRAGRIVYEGRDAALVLSHDVTDRAARGAAPAGREDGGGRAARGRRRARLQQPADRDRRLQRLAARAGARPSAELRDATRSSKAAERAAALTRQLLAFSRRQVLHPQVLDLNEVVAGMEPMLRPPHRRRHRASPSRSAPRCGASSRPTAAQIEQVVLNLAVNARDAMPQGGRLTIETADRRARRGRTSASTARARAGRYVLLAVSDTGSGMSDEVRRRIFEPFFTTKERAAAPGSGWRPSTASSSRAAARSRSTARPAAARRSRSTCRTSPTRPRPSARRREPAGATSTGRRRSSSSRTTRACASSCA